MSSNHPVLHKPAELFRSDLISAMKLPDSMHLDSSSFLIIKEQWRTEWEVGVQVCVSPDHILEASTRKIEVPPMPADDYECATRYIHEDENCNDYVMYDLDEMDLNWRESVNTKRKFRALAGPKGLEEDTLRESLLILETKCQQGMARAVAIEDTLGIEYDEQTVCDVCRDRESEDNNDMIFCDSCNVCVHQMCYGVSSIPMGEWLCRVCTAGDTHARCILCPVKGGALKRVRPGNLSWAHLCCALWIPEIRVGNADKMEPITNVDAIPLSRRSLMCCICRRRHGACIRCSHPLCVTAFHVTCGFQHGLDMMSSLDMVTNTVIHESYCPKHTVMRKSPTKHLYHSPRHAGGVSGGEDSSSNDESGVVSRGGTCAENRPSQLVQLQEQFYNYASIDDLVEKLKLSPKLGALIYNYWKLKRKFQHNRPLLSNLPIETSLESIKAELAAGGIRYNLDGDKNFLKIVLLRHNLEKARNLVYMVQRRERLKKQLLQMQCDQFEQEAEFIPVASVGTCSSAVDSSTNHDTTTTATEDKVHGSSCSSSYREISSEVDEVTMRKTRSMAQPHAAGLSSQLATPTGSYKISTTSTPYSLHHYYHHLHQQQKDHSNHLPSTSRHNTTDRRPQSLTSEHHHVNSVVGRTGRSNSVNIDSELVSTMHENLQGEELQTFIKLSGLNLNIPSSTPSLFPETTVRVTRSNANAVKLADNGSSSSEVGGIAPRHTSSVIHSSRDCVRQDEGKGAVNGSVKRMESLANPYRSLRPSSGVNRKSVYPNVSVHKMGSPIGSGGLEDSGHILKNRTAQSLRQRPYNIDQRRSDSGNMSS